MKIYHLLLVLLLFISFPALLTYSQNPGGNHTFKIIGNKRIPVYTETASEMSVEYDITSTDHLYISEYRKNGFLKTKTRLLFKGEKFNLDKLADYADKGVLLVDGIQADYREDESLASELLYKEEKLQQQTFYYPNGNKQFLIGGNEKMLNGEYKIWYPNGKLNFSGNYRFNLKNREFQQFDESGVLLKKGIYSGGKLISGEAVVQDIIFEKTDQPAKYPGGEEAFNDYLRMKTSELKIVKEINKGEVHSIIINLTISKTGNIEKIDIYGSPNPNDNEILNAAFSDFPGFLPAKVENIPVSSALTLNLVYNKYGLQTNITSDISTENESDIPLSAEKSDSLMSDVYTNVEVMPQYPGGDYRDFIVRNIRYPVEAAENGITGKVIVKFVIEANGSLSNVKVVQSANKFLDAEAKRLVKMMPKWIPGRQDGKTVRVAFSVPVNFVLQ